MALLEAIRIDPEGVAFSLLLIGTACLTLIDIWRTP